MFSPIRIAAVHGLRVTADNISRRESRWANIRVLEFADECTDIAQPG